MSHLQPTPRGGTKIRLTVHYRRQSVCMVNVSMVFVCCCTLQLYLSAREPRSCIFCMQNSAQLWLYVYCMIHSVSLHWCVCTTCFCLALLLLYFCEFLSCICLCDNFAQPATVLYQCHRHDSLLGRRAIVRL